MSVPREAGPREANPHMMLHEYECLCRELVHEYEWTPRGFLLRGFV